MKFLLKLIVLTSGLLLPLQSHAIFCPNNYNIFKIGETMQSIEQKCGKPDRIETKEDDASVPEEWTYYIQTSVGSGAAIESQQGKLKTTIMFDKEKIAQNISVNGFGVPSSTVCGDMIQIGDSQSSVKSACGKPDFVGKEEQDDSKPIQKTNVTTYYYNSSPPVQLIFENNTLKETK